MAFVTYADNISDEDSDTGMNVYVRDRGAFTTTFVSRASGADGAAGQPNSDQPAISGNGCWVAFRGQGDNLSDLDSDAYANVFSRDMLGGPPFVEPPTPPSPPTDPTGGGSTGSASGDGSVGAAKEPTFRLLSLDAKKRKRFPASKGTTVTLRVSKPAQVRLTLTPAVRRPSRSRTASPATSSRRHRAEADDHRDHNREAELGKRASAARRRSS